MKWSVSLRALPQHRYYIYRNQRVKGRYIKVGVERLFALPKEVEDPELGKCFEVEGRLYPKSYFHLHTCTGVEERAQVGAVISYRPFERHDTWPPFVRERQRIVVVDGFTEKQMEGLIEAHYDLNSYREYSPITIEAYTQGMLDKAEKAINPEKARLKVLTSDIRGDYDFYLKDEKGKCAYPERYLAKRRFAVTDMNQGYLIKTDFHDKMRDERVQESANFNLIMPRRFN